MASIPERILTARLVIRCWHPDDAPALRAAIDASLPQLREWLPWALGEPSPVEEVSRRLGEFRARFLAGEDWTFGLFDPGGGVVLGGAGLHRREAPDALEIGYWVRADATGGGLVTEAVEALTRAAFDSAVERVEIRCDPRNVASVAVARTAGFRHVTTLEGNATTATGEPRDTVVWERRPTTSTSR